jgi:membrane associated rhomboid family serine protease
MRLFSKFSILRTQGPLLALILVISFCFLLQLLLGPLAYFRLMAIPTDVVASWESLRSGSFQPRPLGTLFSYAFLHGSVGHLFGNMVFLWIFGALAAELLGQRWMLFTFVFTAICGGILHVALNPTDAIPMLGASGAVMGFEGLYLGMAVRWRLPDPHVWPIARPVTPSRLVILAVVGLLIDFTEFLSGGVGVAYGAHLGGFIGGMLLGAAIVPMPRVALPR